MILLTPNTDSAQVGLGNDREALGEYYISLGALQRLTAPHDDPMRWQRYISNVQAEIGDTLMEQGDVLGALQQYQAVVVTVDAVVHEYPDTLHYRLDLAYGHFGIGRARRVRGERADARSALNRALGIVDEQSAVVRYDAAWMMVRARTLGELGDVLRDEGDFDRGHDRYQESLQIAQGFLERDQDNVDWRHHHAITHLRIGQIAERRGQAPEAAAAYRRAEGSLIELTRVSPDHAVFARDLNRTRSALAGVGAGTAASDRAGRAAPIPTPPPQPGCG